MATETDLHKCKGFQWDRGNAPKIWAKHEVTTGECEQVLLRRPVLLGPDIHRSHHEPRYLALGTTDMGRRLFVVFTIRGELIRVISARNMSRRERQVYADVQEEG